MEKESIVWVVQTMRRGLSAKGDEDTLLDLDVYDNEDAADAHARYINRQQGIYAFCEQHEVQSDFLPC